MITRVRHIASIFSGEIFLYKNQREIKRHHFHYEERETKEFIKQYGDMKIEYITSDYDEIRVVLK